MDSAGFVSEEKVQLMWGKILAKEFEDPGSTPLNMVRILSEITPSCAQAFQRICSMNRILLSIDANDKIVFIRNDIVVPYREEGQQLRQYGLTFDILNELETLGLIKLDLIVGFVALNIPDTGVLTYTNGITREIEHHTSNSVPLGNVLLTEAGKCLQKITQTETLAGYDEIEKQYIIEHGVKYNKDTKYCISDDGNSLQTLNTNKQTDIASQY